jgi:ElaB/YqjD/DUF883 family membrane-anchored ribosome-binding protein
MEPTSNSGSEHDSDWQSRRRDHPAGSRRRQSSQLWLDEFDAILNDSAAQDIDVLKARLHEHLGTARTAFNDAAQSANNYIRGTVDCAIDCTQDYVETKPWQAVSYAAGIAFLLGVLVARR